MVLFRADHLSGEGQQASWGWQRQLGGFGDATMRTSTEKKSTHSDTFNGIVLVVSCWVLLGVDRLFNTMQPCSPP